MDDLSLASEFPAATHEAWAAAVARVLKSTSPDRLVSRTADDLPILPLYPKAEAPAPIPARIGGPWRVAARVDHPEPAQANALALADLEGGAESLTLTFAGAPTGRGFGLAAGNTDALDAALAGVKLDLIAVSLETAPFGGRPAFELVAGLADRRGHPPADLRIDFGLDPAGDLARTGELPVPWPDLAARFAGTARLIHEAGFGGAAARIDTRPYHEAGASEAQELAAALATGVAYLRALEEYGVALAEARDALCFLLVADPDETRTAPKLRAFRRLWALVEASCGLSPKAAILRTETAWRNLTRRDPHTNLLRGTLAAFAAVIGGADEIAILPFTAPLGLPDAFGRRLARNTQLILREEASLWRVADPAAGSGAFETLTDELAAEAWDRFREIEREGGIVETLRSGAFPARIAAMRARREEAIATRREGLIGTSEFPNLAETPVSVLLPLAWDPAPPDGGAGLPLPSRRLAEPFERLRARSDELLASAGRRPRVFLANLGRLAAHGARSTWARNAFEACGVEAVSNSGEASPAALAAAFAAAETATGCLCSSDEVYATEAREAASALARAGARRLFLAGRPGSLEGELREAGVTAFVHAGCDLPALLGEAVAVP